MTLLEDNEKDEEKGRKQFNFQRQGRDILEKETGARMLLEHRK